MASATRRVICRYCGGGCSVPFGSSWDTITYIPWCPTDFKDLYAALPEGFSTEDYLAAYKKIRPKDPFRAEKLEVELGLRSPCPCNNCRGEVA